jgi:hypothetical protein
MFLRFFTSLTLLAFGMFLMSPIVVVASEGSDIIITGSSSFDTCSTLIVCEKTSDTSYQCHTTSATMASLGGQVHQISVGKTSPIILAYARYREEDSTRQSREVQINHIERDTFIYPFVGITKIQV